MEISTLGKKIKELRLKRNISMTEFSKLANVGTTTLWEIETGHRQSISTKNLEKISKCLNVSIDELLGYNKASTYNKKDIEQQLKIIFSNSSLRLGNEPITLVERDYIVNSLNSVINELLFVKTLLKLYNVDISQFNTADEILQEKKRLMNKIKEEAYM